MDLVGWGGGEKLGRGGREESMIRIWKNLFSIKIKIIMKKLFKFFI